MYCNALQSPHDKMEFHFQGLVAKKFQLFSILPNFHFWCSDSKCFSEAFHFRFGELFAELNQLTTNSSNLKIQSLKILKSWKCDFRNEARWESERLGNSLPTTRKHQASVGVVQRVSNLTNLDFKFWKFTTFKFPWTRWQNEGSHLSIFQSSRKS